ncbi:hypothetical protein AALC17_13380 [Oscillospiraceae bacterium 38-13]
MRRVKQLPSRRKRALRRVLIAAAAVFLVNRIFLIGLLFPIQAIRHNEERLGTGRTAVVCRDWDPGFRWDYLSYLTESETVTMLSGARLGSYGWTDAFGVAVDCTEEAPLYGGWRNMSWTDGPSRFCVFGRVGDPDIVRLEIQLRYLDWKLESRTALTWNSEREDWMEKDGRYYFLFQTHPPFNWADFHPGLNPLAVGLDEAGNEVVRIELTQGASCHFS